jgi:hypothetical protein
MPLTKGREGRREVLVVITRSTHAVTILPGCPAEAGSKTQATGKPLTDDARDVAAHHSEQM